MPRGMWYCGAMTDCRAVRQQEVHLHNSPEPQTKKAHAPFQQGCVFQFNEKETDACTSGLDYGDNYWQFKQNIQVERKRN